MKFFTVQDRYWITSKHIIALIFIFVCLSVASRYWLYLVLLGCCITVAYSYFFKQNPHIKFFTIACGLLAIYFIIFSNKNLDSVATSKVMTLQGNVSSLVALEAKRIKFEFVNNTGKKYLVYKYYRKALDDTFNIRPGDCLQFEAKLRPVRGLKNPYLFDYEQYLTAKSITAIAIVRKDIAKLPDCKQFSFNNLRQLIADKIDNLTINNNAKSLIKTLSIGDSRSLSNELWQIFQHSGIIHLVVISGLHIGIVASLFFLLGVLIEKLVSVKYFITPFRIAAACSLMAATIYAIFSGLGTSAVRALVMLTIFLAIKLLRLNINLSKIILMAILATLLLQPYSYFLNGFWLSFGAVISLIYYFSVNTKNPKQQRKITNYLTTLTHTQVAIAIGILVLLAYSIGFVNLMTPIINLLLVPLYCLLIIPLILFNLLLLIIGIDLIFIWQLIASLINSSIYILQAFKPYAYIINFNRQPIAIYLTAAIACFILMQPFFKLLRVASLLALTTIFILSYNLRKPQKTLTFLDVGQGLATAFIVTTKSKTYTVVYDTGTHFSDKFSSGRDIVAKYLLRMGIKHIDVLVISHKDSDHSGGAVTLAEAMPVAKIFASSDLPNLTINKCTSGINWQFADTEFAFLHPNPDYTTNRTNDLSCVLLITFAEQNILLPGDISAKVEENLLEQLPKITIMSAPHHGSKSSSSMQFLETTMPKFVVFSTGYLNRFKHPHLNVISRYQNLGSTIFDTGINGAISFNWIEKQLTTTTARQQ